MDGVEEVTIDFQDAVVRVVYDGRRTDPEAVATRLAEAGYPPLDGGAGVAPIAAGN